MTPICPLELLPIAAAELFAALGMTIQLPASPAFASDSSSSYANESHTSWTERTWVQGDIRVKLREERVSYAYYNDRDELDARAEIRGLPGGIVLQLDGAEGLVRPLASGGDEAAQARILAAWPIAVERAVGRKQTD